MKITLCLFFATCVATAMAQSAQPAPSPQATASATKPRVYLQAATHANTWLMYSRDQSMEMAKNFTRDCPGVRITLNQEAADYTVILNHIEAGLVIRDNQMQVADKNGDLLSMQEKGGIKGSAKRACSLILSDWNSGDHAPSASNEAKPARAKSRPTNADDPDDMESWWKPTSPDATRTPAK